MCTYTLLHYATRKIKLIFSFSNREVKKLLKSTEFRTRLSKYSYLNIHFNLMLLFENLIDTEFNNSFNATS